VAITLTELQEKLKLIDEISVMEILEITSEDLANRFMDRIESKYDQLITEFDEGDDLNGSEEPWWEFNDTQSEATAERLDELFTDDDIEQ